MMVLDFTAATKVLVHAQSEMIEATPMSEPDPAWYYRDRKGHEHRWEHGYELPTLENICDVTSVDDDGDEYCAVSHWECRLCFEHIRPGYREPRCTQYVAGPVHRDIYVTVGPLFSQLGDVFKVFADNEECEVKIPDFYHRLFGRVISVMQSPTEAEIHMQITRMEDWL